MIILHAGYDKNSFCLWGETPASGAVTKGRKRNNSPEISPFDAGHAGLTAALADVMSGLKVQETARCTIWLPTWRGEPLASSPLIAEIPSPAGQARPGLAAWSITVIPLKIAATIDLLCACVGRETLGQGVIIGRDLSYWVAALRFAGALVARQQFLPNLQLNDGSYNACWEPVISGDDTRRLSQLARAMPHACRALAASAEPPATSPLTLLHYFLGEIVDQLVRSGNNSSGSLRSAKSGQAGFDSLHDQWMHALRSADGLLNGTTSELAALKNQANDWRRPVSISLDAPFRLCFRLEEPEQAIDVETLIKSGRRHETQEGDWYVRYLLQALDDPSLLIPVADAWSARGRAAKALKRGAFNPREYLLSALGQAASLDPQIEQSLKTALPGGYDLDVVAANDFLMEKAWLLEQSGFGVLLPAWWTRKGTKLRLTARANVKSPKMQGATGLSLKQIVQFDWEIALGGQ
ncbi:MAG: SNF2 helicase-associated domain-containing protein, partial [Blastocatellia bacterium]|nr:SNF2 helicase-associated domain-containing protein [Blastocatellia bacterium]